MHNSTAISTTKQKVLAFFCLHPGQKFHERETQRETGISAGAAHSELKSLERDHFLISERKGKMVFYQLNESRPLVRQYKTMAIIFSLEPLILELEGLADLVVLFGSSVSGEFVADSDVDLFIVSSHEDKVYNALHKFGDAFDKEIRPVIVSMAEWMDYEKKQPAFYQELIKGMVLHQSEYYESKI